MKKSQIIMCVVILCFAVAIFWYAKEGNQSGVNTPEMDGALEETMGESVIEELQEVAEVDVVDLTIADNVGMVNIDYHSVDEILTLYHSMGLEQEESITFSKEPDFTHFTTSGVLDSVIQQEALNTLNFARYIAGISYDVTINNGYVQNAQDAAFALALLGGGADHYIDQPSGMSDEMFASAYLGTTKGNISAGIESLTTNIIHGWLSDEGENNLYTLGHRRTALAPSLTETGFGLVYADESAKYSTYNVMSVQGVNAEQDVAGVAWPAQTMPIEYFDSNYPWSFSTGTVLMGNTQITITRENDGTTWTMIDDFLEGPSGDGFITINNDYYGQLGCIIFMPDYIVYTPGDIYHVEISGSYTACYTVTFFSLEDDYIPVPSVTFEVPDMVEETQSEITLEEETREVDLTAEITRGQFANILGMFCEAKWAMTGDYTNTSFVDLVDSDENQARNKYIIALNQWGILQGTTATTFSPDAPITKEEIATILLAVKQLFLNVSITQDISEYKDVDMISDEHLEGVSYMIQIGVITPDENNCINPLVIPTIEEVTEMCSQLFS